MSQHEIIHELMYRSGIIAQMASLEKLGNTWAKRYSRNLESLDSSEHREVFDHIGLWARTVVTPAFSQEYLKADITSAFESSSTDALVTALDFFRSPAWEQYEQAIAKMRTSYGQQHMARQLATMRNQQEAPSIALKRQQLLRLTREYELLMLLTWDASEHFAAPLERLLPQNLLQTAEQKSTMRQSFESHLKQRLEVRYKYIFHELPQWILEGHLRFFNSPSGRHFVSLRQQALTTALSRAEQRAVQSLQEHRNALEGP